MTAPRLSFKALTVRYGSTVALRGVDLDLQPGQIMGLLGHNGAGKSTLLNVATGAVQATEGELLLDGAIIPRGAGPREISQLGITVIHQEPALAANLSILDNLYLARQERPSRAERSRRGREALTKVGGAHLELSTPVGALSLGERQIVDLARGVLAGDVRVLLLDEPTAALGEAETRALHRLIRDFAAAGTAVVYVSHRLPDIVEVCQRIVVLQGGEVVLDRSVDGMDAATLSRALAPEVDLDASWEPQPGDQRLVIDRTGPPLQFRDGEVVGLFGVAAGEQFTLLASLFGIGDTPGALLGGVRYAPGSPREALRHRMHYVPADRERDGLIPGLSAVDNTFLPWRSRLSRRQVATQYQAIRGSLNVHGPGGNAPIDSFSGGNRQKHLLARWLFPVPPKVLLLAQPTQGVDVGAKHDIKVALRSLAATGVCVLVASAETDEIASLCDRAYVLAHGEQRELHRGAAYEERLLAALMALIPEGSAA